MHATGFGLGKDKLSMMACDLQFDNKFDLMVLQYCQGTKNY
jgi:hypothetical protein